MDALNLSIREINSLFTKKELKPYHIDYIYSKGLNPVELEVGSYSKWSAYSDHSPLIVEYA